MRFKSLNIILCAVLMLVFLSVNVYATETVNEIDLDSAKELALKNSREMKNYFLAQEKARYTEYIAKDDYEEAAYSGYYSLLNEYLILQQQLAAGDLSVAARIAALEKEMDKARASSDSNLINAANLLDKYQAAQASYDDKIRAAQDFEKELSYKVEQIYSGILQLENQIDLLELTYQQKITELNYERIKKEIGVSNTDIDELAVEASAVSSSIKYWQDKLLVTKREFNDLLGREPNEPLQLVEYNVTINYGIPSYDYLLSELVNNYAVLTQLQRDIGKDKGDLADINVTGNSNTQRLIEIGIEEKKSALKAETLKLSNAVTDLIAEINSKQEAYRLAEIAMKSAQKYYEKEQKKYEIGQISKMQYMSASIKYKEAINSYRLSGYGYSLARVSIELAQQGILLSN